MSWREWVDGLEYRTRTAITMTKGAEHSKTEELRLIEGYKLMSETLERVEWSGRNKFEDFVCPSCGATEDSGAHEDDCPLGRALDHLRGDGT